MGCSENNETDPDEQEPSGMPSKEEMREELIARGYTEVDFEVREARASRMLEELHVHKILKRFKFDFSHLEKPGS